MQNSAHDLSQKVSDDSAYYVDDKWELLSMGITWYKDKSRSILEGIAD